jgi:four helix bundle protein
MKSARREISPKAEGRRPEGRPKPEGRRPREGGNPKAEGARGRFGFHSASAFWTWANDCEMSNEALVLREDHGPGNVGISDLPQRTARFGESIIGLAKKIPQTAVNERLISRLVGAGTTIGANYCDADDSVSRKEFKLKIGTCRKESKETMFFLRMVAKSEPALADEARLLWREAKELNLIFGTIWRKQVMLITTYTQLFRISAFGLLSAFGFRPSALLCRLST